MRVKLFIKKLLRNIKVQQPNNSFNLIIPFGTLFAVASLSKKCANPYGPELQLKRMLDSPFRARKRNSIKRN